MGRFFDWVVAVCIAITLCGAVVTATDGEIVWAFERGFIAILFGICWAQSALIDSLIAILKEKLNMPESE